MTTERILVVDDEETLCEVLKLNLENEGFDVDTASSAEEALKLDLRRYSIILLDIMMGEMSGIRFAKIIKSDVETADIPIIFCTARDTEDDMVLGLNLGADDYIMKPYTVRNIIARVKTVLRRTSGHKSVEKSNTLVVDTLKLDLDLKTCTVDGKEIKLTKKEFELLAFLIAHRGKICSREHVGLKEVGACMHACSVMPEGCSPKGSSVHQFSRQEYWSRLPFPLPGEFHDLGIKPKCLGSPLLTGRFLTTA